MIEIVKAIAALAVAFGGGLFIGVRVGRTIEFYYLKRNPEELKKP